MRKEALDTYGRPACREYTFGKILLDHSFERRLKLFDPSLKLVYDNSRQRWTVLEWALDNSGWNVLITAEDDEGNEKPLGEWVFNKLWVWRKRAEERNKKGVDYWLRELRDARNELETKTFEEHSKEAQYKICNNINRFRKAIKKMNNEPASDVTAGYPKT